MTWQLGIFLPFAPFTNRLSLPWLFTTPSTHRSCCRNILVSDRMYLSMNTFLLTRNCDSDGPNKPRELREFIQVLLVACFYFNTSITY